MSTLMTAPEAVVARCDRCRLVWPVQEEADLGWFVDDEADLHLCPRCRDLRVLTAEERALLARDTAAAKRLLGLRGPGSGASVAA